MIGPIEQKDEDAASSERTAWVLKKHNVDGATKRQWKLLSLWHQTAAVQFLYYYKNRVQLFHY